MAVAVLDADQALQRLEDGAFDLVVGDIHLGQRSGVEWYQEAERRLPGLERRFVFITGDVLGSDLREFFATTGARHLAKPFEVTERLQEVARAIEA